MTAVWSRGHLRFFWWGHKSPFLEDLKGRKAVQTPHIILFYITGSVTILIHLVPCVSCVHRKFLEGSGVGSGGCVVHACRCAWEWVMLHVGGCNVVATEHGRCDLCCIQKLWSAWTVLSLYGSQSVSYLLKFYCCWTWQIWIVILCGRLLSE